MSRVPTATASATQGPFGNAETTEIAVSTLRKHVRELEKRVERANGYGYIRDTTHEDGTAIYAYYVNGLLNECMLSLEPAEHDPNWLR